MLTQLWPWGTSRCLNQVLTCSNARTQFSCFTITKVQILTSEGGSRARFACFISTKVQILTSGGGSGRQASV
jgi:hypothetical protein